MYLEERVPLYLEELKNKYFCSELDFSQVFKNKKKIMHKSASRQIIKECNEQIDLDFIKESNLLENIEDVDVHTFLEDEETEIVHDYQMKHESMGKLDPATMTKKCVEGCVVMATNPKLGVLAFTTQHLAALKYILKKARTSQLKRKNSGHFAPLTHEEITTANEMILPGEFDVPSYYRNEYTSGGCHVTGANWTPVGNEKVPARMEALVQWYNETEMNPIIKAAILHCEFIKIHPFFDGNGRTARLLVNYELAKNNLPTIVIKARNKKAYLAALERGIMTGDVTNLVIMMEEKVLESQKKQLDAVEKYKNELKSQKEFKE